LPDLSGFFKIAQECKPSGLPRSKAKDFLVGHKARRYSRFNG